jgi:hypothetical protein
MAKLLVCLGIALLLSLSTLLIGKYLIDAKDLVMEVWANMDNAASARIKASAFSLIRLMMLR